MRLAHRVSRDNDTRMSSITPRKANMSEAKLKVDDQEIDLPVIVGTENERAICIAKLRAEPG